MPAELSIDDALTRFHDRWAGTSSEVFGRGRLPDGRTSYQWLVDPLRRGPVLDLGCGDGAALALLAERGLHSTGIDRSQAELDLAAQRALPGVELFHADLRELELPAGRHEVVISHMALMLVPEPEQVAARIDHTLAPGGRLRIVVGRRPAERPAPVQTYLSGLRDVLQRHGPEIDYPQAAWDLDAVHQLLPGWKVSSEDLVLHTRVPVEEAARFLRISYYGAGLLEGDGEAELDSLIADTVQEHASGDHLDWELPLLGIEARKPF